MKTVTAPAQAQVDSDQNRPIELYDIYLKTETLHFTDHHDAVSFGDVGCAVDVNSAANKKVKTTGAGCTQTVIQSADFTEGADYFLDGELHVMNGPLAGQKRRVVASQAGQATVQFGFTQSPAAGVTIHVYRGCDKSPSVCLNRFNNKINFGGFDTIPQELVRR